MLINDNLSQQISLIYDYWFKQFNFPNDVGRPYAQNGGELSFDSALKRNIPVGWSSASLIHNELSRPIEPGVQYFYKKNYLATANIVGTTITDGEYVTYENRESRANMQPKAFSVWFAKMKNSVKHLFISSSGQYFIDKYILSTGFEGLLCRDYAFSYICGIISDPTFEITKDRFSHGATQQSVNNEDLDLYKILIPPHRILQEYSRVATPFYEKMNVLAVETNKLIALRDYLLPLLLNGQVVIR